MELSIDSEDQHRDLLNKLNGRLTLSEKISLLHKLTRQNHDFIHRIGIAVYDPKCDTLRTFAHSTDGDNPLRHYQCKLSEAKSLHQIFQNGRPRVVDDLAVFGEGRHEHTSRISTHGFRASYTIPMYHDEQFSGFVFFNSRQSGVFRQDALQYLDMIGRLVALLVSMELRRVQTLLGAVKTATCFSGHKDPETGAHLERMACFSRLIANDIAGDYGLSDEGVEAIYWFAPMHDVGKIAIPDHIMRKPGPLSADEFELMKTHTTRGKDIITAMLGNFDLVNMGYASMIGNIAECHHENVDGSGYPHGLAGEDIPIEARIIAVADVFDALTSERAYKRAWSNDDAFFALREMAHRKLDAKCVDILLGKREEIERIQARYRDAHDQSHQNIH